MKNIILSAILAIGILSPITWAQSESGETSSSAQAPGIAEVAKDMKSFKGKINANATDVSQLPGFRRPNSIPNVTIVDANGNVITSGHGALLLQWKDYIRK